MAASLRLDLPENAPLELRVQGVKVFTGCVTRGGGGAAFRVLTRRGRAAENPSGSPTR